MLVRIFHAAFCITLPGDGRYSTKKNEIFFHNVIAILGANLNLPPRLRIIILIRGLFIVALWKENWHRSLHMIPIEMTL